MPPAAERPRRRNPAALLLTLLAAALLGSAAFVLARDAVSAQQPFGAPLPPVPEPIFERQPEVQKDSSVVQGRLPDVWIDRFAPQPDGLAPLLDKHQSQRLDLTLHYPYGASAYYFPDEQVLEDGVDSQVRFVYDQALYALKISVIGYGGAASAKERARLLVAELKGSGAADMAEPAAVELPAGEFIVLEYRRSTADGDLIHRLYLLPLKKNVVVFDLMLRPEHAELARRYADKIMASLEPGERLKAAIVALDAPKGVE